MAGKQRLGDLLVAKGLVDRQAVDEALRVQFGGKRRLGDILIRLGHLSEEALLEVLSEQLETPIIDVEREIQKDVCNLLPRYLCRKYGIIPLSRKEGRNLLRLGMMNPMDDDAIEAVRGYTGMEVQPELARRSAIEEAIDKYVPFSRADLVNVLSLSPRQVAAISLVLALIVAAVAGSSWYRARYGEVNRLADRVIYKNFDLTIEVANGGKEVSLRGRGAHSTGIFMVSFPSPDNLQRFVAKKATQFSSQELAWLEWVLERIGATPSPVLAEGGSALAR